jgi:hypothetical protein
MILVSLLILAISFEAEAMEPSIHEVQKEAIRYMEFDQKEMDGWKKKARWSAALPRLQVGFDRELKDVVSLSTKDSVSISNGDVFVGPDETDFDQDFNQGTSFDVRVVWYLNELIFNRDTLAASSERRDWIRERTRTLEDVTESYFTRKRLLDELKEKEDPQPLREKKKLLLDQMTARIDAYTGGWFSEQLGQ